MRQLLYVGFVAQKKLVCDEYWCGVYFMYLSSMTSVVADLFAGPHDLSLLTSEESNLSDLMGKLVFHYNSKVTVVQ